MKRTTGIGGVFFKANNTPELGNWYRDTLGFQIGEWGASLVWGDTDANNKNVCTTAWSLFKADAKYFAPSTLPYMINYRVHDLKALLDTLRTEGVEVVGGIDEFDYGKFAWIMDPEGRKIELWEPIDSGFGEAPPVWTENVIGLAAITLKSADPGKITQWYKKHLGIDKGFSYRDLDQNKIRKIEWSVSKDLEGNKPYTFSYYAKKVKARSSFSDPEDNKIILLPA